MHTVATVLTLASLFSGQGPEHPVAAGDPAPAALQALRDRYRPILIFTPSESVPSCVAQEQILASHASELADRNIVLVAVPYRRTQQPDAVNQLLRPVSLTPLGESEARRLFHVSRNSFTVLLLGKDGGEKLRSHAPISYERLRDLIDSMPMRQQEMREKNAR